MAYGWDRLSRARKQTYVIVFIIVVILIGIKRIYVHPFRQPVVVTTQYLMYQRGSVESMLFRKAIAGMPDSEAAHFPPMLGLSADPATRRYEALPQDVRDRAARGDLAAVVVVESAIHPTSRLLQSGTTVYRIPSAPDVCKSQGVPPAQCLAFTWVPQGRSLSAQALQASTAHYVIP
jgi:hypothetical protein